MKRTANVKERCLLQTDSAYPAVLRQIRSAPGRLYVRGMLPDPDRPAVAIIGARRCSSYGRDMARLFAGALSAAGVQIISGMASGIDGIAQRAALETGGISFGVLGCGTDLCYPAGNRDLYEALLEKGGLLSEYPAGTPPVSGHFPARNRIISALSDAVLVIEAKERSGTLITVDFALEQGRDVYALPGRLTDGWSEGCNRLIRQGAGIALTPDDILEALVGSGKNMAVYAHGKGRPVPGRTKETCCADMSVHMDRRERIVWEHMGERPVTLQELYEALHGTEAGEGMGLPEITDILMNFRIQGLISGECGNKYERKAKILNADAKSADRD